MEKYAAIYARQSLDKKDSISIESQIDFCKHEIVGEFKVYQDKGYSGKNIRRPAFERLLADVREGNVSKLVCYRLDRISRSIMDFGTIWNMLSINGVEFVSVNEKFDTSTPIGRAMLYIIMVFAQLERETTAERITDNYYERVKQGAWPGGPAPYGYDIAAHRINGMKTLVPNDNTSIVKRIFALYSMPDMSLGQLAKILNAEGIPAARRKVWDNVSLARLLHNPIYAKAGIEVYAYYKSIGLKTQNEPSEFTGEKACIIVGKRTANERKYTDLSDHVLAITTHDGIVPGDTFVACQIKLAKNKQIKNSGKGKYTWLSGLLHCNECGYSLKVQNDKGKLRLVCSGRTNLGICQATHSEDLAHVESTAEAAIIERMKSIENQSADQEQPDDSIKIELYTIEEKISNLIKALSEGQGVTVKYISSEIEKLEARKNEIINSLAQSALPDRDDAFKIDFNQLTFDEKKVMAKLIISTVNCDANTVDIRWK
ncbi:MAG: recombinase family protein [Clostridiaceae bacterium]|nr:recombinase family protein [Clostridiaceae bacterium]